MITAHTAPRQVVNPTHPNRYVNGVPGMGQTVKVEIENRLLKAAVDWFFADCSINYVLLDNEGRPLEDSQGHARHYARNDETAIHKNGVAYWFCRECGVYVGLAPVLCGPCVEKIVDDNRVLAKLLEVF